MVVIIILLQKNNYKEVGVLLYFLFKKKKEIHIVSVLWLAYAVGCRCCLLNRSFSHSFLKIYSLRVDAFVHVVVQDAVTVSLPIERSSASYFHVFVGTNPQTRLVCPIQFVVSLGVLCEESHVDFRVLVLYLIMLCHCYFSEDISIPNKTYEVGQQEEEVETCALLKSSSLVTQHAQASR